MDLWGWVIAYVIGFSVLQVLIYRYLRGRGNAGAGGSSGENAGTSTGAGANTGTATNAIERTAPPRERRDAEGGSAIGEPSYGADPLYPTNGANASDMDTTAAIPASRRRHCPRCGTPNEPDSAFRYCRQCVRPLG